MTAVRIRWRDAHDIGPGDWLDESDDEIECILETVGHLVRETALFVVISHTIGEDGMHRGAFAIPRSCVVGRVDLPEQPRETA